MARGREAPATAGAVPDTNGVAHHTTDSSNPFLKTIQNRLRNLKKSIEKANKLETAQASGSLVLDAEQERSVRSKEAKELLYRELEELLIKQSALVEQEAATARQEAKRVEQQHKEELDMAVKKALEAAEERMAQVVEEVRRAAESSQMAIAAAPTTPVEEEQTPDIPDASPPTINHGELVRSAVWKVLSVMHVIDFLANEAESNETVISELNDLPTESDAARTFSLEDIEGIKYFSRMLTSPNGAVTVQDAVSTSTHHAVNFVGDSSEEVFTGTTYAALSAAVSAMTEIPVLKHRGQPLPELVEEISVVEAPSAPLQPSMPDLNFFAQPEPELQIPSSSAAEGELAKPARSPSSSVAATEDTVAALAPSVSSLSARDVPETAGGALEPPPVQEDLVVETPAQTGQMNPIKPTTGHATQVSGGQAGGARGRNGSRSRGAASRGRGGRGGRVYGRPSQT